MVDDALLLGEDEEAAEARYRARLDALIGDRCAETMVLLREADEADARLEVYSGIPRPGREAGRHVSNREYNVWAWRAEAALRHKGRGVVRSVCAGRAVARRQVPRSRASRRVRRATALAPGRLSDDPEPPLADEPYRGLPHRRRARGGVRLVVRQDPRGRSAFPPSAGLCHRRPSLLERRS